MSMLSLMRLLRRAEPAANPSTDLRDEFAAGWDRLEIYAQDIDSTTDGTLYATEALPRWRRSTHELWDADMILPIVENPQIVEHCACWATELALTMWARSERRLHGGRLAVKFQSAQLTRPRLAAELAVHLERLELNPSELILEIPDHCGPDDCRAAVDRLRPLTGRGALLALDAHRGANSSTQPTSDWLPSGSVVKLDPALTMAADEPHGREILSPTVETLRRRGYAVAAHSVERPEQLAAIADCGIQWAQGIVVAGPTPLC